MPYTNDQKEKARDLWIGGVNPTAISKRDDMPSKPTLYKWAKEGETTEGRPWDTIKEENDRVALVKAREQSLAKRAQDGRDFVTKLTDFIEGDAFDAIEDKITARDFDVSIGDLEKLAKVYALLTNADDKVMEMVIYTIREVGAICFEIMDDRQFALFKARSGALQHKIEVKMNPLAHSGPIQDVV